MNIKIIGLVGLLAFASYSAYVIADDDVEEVEEFEEDEYEDIDDFDDYEDEDTYDDEDSEESDMVEDSDESTSVQPAKSDDVVETKLGTRTVTKIDCNKIREQIKDLEKQLKQDSSVQPQLDNLKQAEKRQCGQTGRNRPVRNYNNAAPMPNAEPVQLEPVADVKLEPPVEKPMAPKLSKKEMADNIARGLCADGTKPNKFGCCAGETFKDMGNLKFLCCSKENKDDCHQPLKK